MLHITHRIHLQVWYFKEKSAQYMIFIINIHINVLEQCPMF